MSDLGPLSEVVCVRRESFAISGPTGDITPGGDQGVYARDTRVLNLLRLTVDGLRPIHLAGSSVGGHRATFHAYLPPSVDTEVDPTLSVTRRRLVDGGLREEIDLANASAQAVTLRVGLEVGSDFAYIFDVKHGHVLPQVPAEDDGDTVAFQRPGGDERVEVTVAGAEVVGNRLLADVEVEPGGTSTVVVELRARDRYGWVAPGPDAAEELRAPARGVTGPARGRQRVRCSEARFSRLIRRSVNDLESLTLHDPDDPDDRFVAAGSPWFLTLFGRDSIWAAFMALPYDLALAGGTLRALARRQGTRSDDETEEQPGKILHEVRRGALAERGDLPPFYFGSVDATPLFVVLAHEAWCWGLPVAELDALLPNVEAALAWMRDHGDPDGDGFLEYLPRGSRTLANQGWKDSDDGVRYADGTIARAPLALCEVQGYAYDAAVRGAALLDAFGRPGADEWRAWADRLGQRFREAFWTEDGDGPYPAIALDGDGRVVDSVASNMGHLLATGILDASETEHVARRLGSPSMASGWGLRTLSADTPGYNPLSYHCGSVWPHDTAIAVWGLARARHGEVAGDLLRSLVRAGPSFNYRLPELFTGFSTTFAPHPVPYPAACRPQAWAAGGAMLLARAVLGIEADVPRGRIVLRPMRPAPFDWLEIERLPIAGGLIDVSVRGGAVAVETHEAQVDVVVEHLEHRTMTERLDSGGQPQMLRTSG